METGRIGVGLVGYGYWGPNLARNFYMQKDCSLLTICDLSPGRAELAASNYPSVRVTDNFQDLLDDPGIHLVLIATPVSTHYDFAKRALLAGKDVLVEKPVAATVSEAQELVDLSEETGRILFVDHTYLFTGSVKKILELLADNELGEIEYIDSVRINLGLFSNDVNVLFDLAPHDLSLLCCFMKDDPVSVQALGAPVMDNDQEAIAYLHLVYPNEVIAHCHISWLSPVKIRRTIIGGTEKMIVFDDNEITEKLKIYDRGVEFRENQMSQSDIYKIIVDYRMGDIVSPRLSTREALAEEADYLVECIKTRQRPFTDGRFGLRVVKILEAAQTSLRNGGQLVEIGS